MYLISMELACKSMQMHIYNTGLFGLYGRAYLKISQRNFIVHVQLGSKNVSGIGFTVENICQT